MNLTQPVASNAHGTRSTPADQAPSPTRLRNMQKAGVEETDAGEDWLYAATADPAFWLKEVGY